MSNLKTFYLWYAEEGIKTNILEAGASSLQKLIFISKRNENTLGIKLLKLKHFIATLSSWCKEMIMLNSETLEYIALEVASYDELADLPESDFPALKQIFVDCRPNVGVTNLDNVESDLTNAKAVLLSKYPHVHVHFVDISHSLSKHVPDFLKNEALGYNFLKKKL